MENPSKRRSYQIYIYNTLIITKDAFAKSKYHERIEGTVLKLESHCDKKWYDMVLGSSTILSNSTPTLLIMS